MAAPSVAVRVWLICAGRWPGRWRQAERPVGSAGRQDPARAPLHVAQDRLACLPLGGSPATRMRHIFQAGCACDAGSDHGGFARLVAARPGGGHAVVKSVLVTGASTGIGEACALRLDRLGHRVYAGVRSQEHAHGLRQRGSDRMVPVFLDVTDQAQIDAVAGQIAGSGGGLDGVVNNTGIGRGGPLEYLPLETWRDQLEVNVLGQVAVTEAMLPCIRAAHGRIVFMGSISGKVATQLTGPYGASKFAIEAIGESLRSELRPWASACQRSSPRGQDAHLGQDLARSRPAGAGAAGGRQDEVRQAHVGDPQGHPDPAVARREPGTSLPWSSTRCSPAARRPATWPGPTPGCRPCWSGGCPADRGKRSSAGSPGRRLAIATSRARPAGTAATAPATGSPLGRWRAGAQCSSTWPATDGIARPGITPRASKAKRGPGGCRSAVP